MSTRRKFMGSLPALLAFFGMGANVIVKDEDGWILKHDYSNPDFYITIIKHSKFPLFMRRVETAKIDGNYMFHLQWVNHLGKKVFLRDVEEVMNEELKKLGR